MKNGWETKQLGELAELKGRIGWRGLTAKEYTEEGPLFVSVHSLNYGDYVDFRDAFHISEERYDESPEIMLQPNDVLICKDGAGIGKVGIVGKLPDRATINSSLLLVRSGKEILPKFLYRCLSSPYFQQIVNSRLNGATTPHLYQRDITKFPVVLPPLAEQQRIVGVLDEAFGDIASAKAKTEKNFQNARAIFESHLQFVFVHRGNGWVEKTFEEVCDKITDGTHHSPQTQFRERAPGTFPYITSKNIRNNYMDLSNVAYIERAFHSEVYVRCQPSLGDVLLTKDGANTGNVTLNTLDEPFSLLSSVCLIKTDPSILRPAFLCYYLQSSSGLSSIVGQMTGAAIKRIVLKDIKKAVIPFPPLKEQDSMVTRLNSLLAETQSLAQLYERKLDALEALKKSLLHRAFTGEL